MRSLFIALLVGTLAGCGQSTTEAPAAIEPAADSARPPETAPADTAPGSDLAEILAAQPEEVQARYPYRHPEETLSFFGIEPGMTVVEGLPGGGWYSKLLIPLLGESGHLIGVDYPIDIWPNFGGFATEEFIAKKATWAVDWPAQAQAWRGDDGAQVSAFISGQMPQELAGTADAVVLIRALHNLARFADQGDYLQTFTKDAYDVLKPGGILGVVQHEARPDMPDDWANGSNGYLKKAFVIAQLEAAGFEYVAASDVNENPADQPGAEDAVWRLPPSLGTSQEDAALREQMQAIGESNRMTLKFLKPGA